jgi:hypothetical protein
VRTCIGKVLPDWPDEKYWDVRCPSVKAVLKAVSCRQVSMCSGWRSWWALDLQCPGKCKDSPAPAASYMPYICQKPCVW